ncbi:MAG: Arm DNA-binding domain-containing protein [Alphaproteobacteria bacterium]|nr:Arm DNA-binding domain-containing protein [Alphaproteobacteria bacterium]
MATIRRHGANWQARVRKTGYKQQTKTFRTKRDAEAWAREMEAGLDKGIVRDRGAIIGKTLRDLLQRYHDDHAVPKRKGKQQAYLVRMWMRHPIADRLLESLTTADFCQLRDERLRSGVSSKTAREDLLMFKTVYKLAAAEYGFSGLQNPLNDVELPKAGKGRDRRLSVDEVRIPT